MFRKEKLVDRRSDSEVLASLLAKKLSAEPGELSEVSERELELYRQHMRRRAMLMEGMKVLFNV